VIFSAIGGLIGISVCVWGILHMRGSTRKYAQYQAGRLAQQLGLNVVEGDPATNLGVRLANPEMRRGHSPSDPLHVRVVLTGRPQGLPVELRYEYREQTEGVLTITREERFACRMTVLAGRSFPPFEVTSRQLRYGTVVPLQDLPELSTGRPDIDATYVVSSAAPDMAELLGETLDGSAPLAGTGVHLLGDGRGVAFVMQNKGFPFLTSSLNHAVLMRDQLTALARRLDG
jgi:hypothetical protein